MRFVNQFFGKTPKKKLEDFEYVAPILGSGKFTGACLAENGFIYFCPHNFGSIGKFDPTREKLTLIDGLPSGSSKWHGIARAANGKLYCTNYSNSNILEINPIDDSWILFPSNQNFNRGICLAQNGFLYSVSQQLNGLLEIDPVNRTTVRFANIVDPNMHGLILAEDGLLYGVPNANANIVEIDPITKNVNKYNLGIGTNQTYRSQVLGLNGKIYAVPYNYSSILEFDPFTKEFNFYGNIPGNAKFVGCQLLPNGKVLGFSFNFNGHILFDPLTKDIEIIPLRFSNINQKWYGGTISIKSTAIGAPFSIQSTLISNNIGTLGSDDLKIPSNLSELPFSLYNKYLNKY